MKKQIINKTTRVFSLQPNKNHEAIFVRRYTSHLVPSLKKINTNKHSSQINHKSLQQTMKHEVDMALTLSAQEFAWGRFLQHKLLSSHDEDPSYSSKINQERSKYEQDGEEEEEEEEAEIKKRLKELQKLLPGGEEMKMDEMLSEIGSYIVCLELQMIVLKSLVQDNTL